MLTRASDDTSAKAKEPMRQSPPDSDDPSSFRVLFHGSEVPRDIWDFKDAAQELVQDKIIPVLNRKDFFGGSPLDHVSILVHYIDREHERTALRVHPRLRFHWRKPHVEGILVGVFAISSRIRKLTVRQYASFLLDVTIEVLEAVAKKYDCNEKALSALKTKRISRREKDPFCGRRTDESDGRERSASTSKPAASRPNKGGRNKQ